MKIRYDENGVHLFNRNTGANLLIDELSVPHDKWSNAPRHVSFALTNICDLKCAYCYAPKDRSELEFEDLKNWITEIDLGGSLGVGFGGGEPTLYPRLAELCNFATVNTDLAVSFTTHGHRITAAMCEQLKGNVHFIRVSVDGLGSTYEKLRGRSFDTLLGQIQLIKAIAPFGINYVLNADTIPDLIQVANFWEQQGATELLILPEIDAKGMFSADILLRLKQFLDGYTGKLPLRINENCANGLPIAQPFNDTNPLLAYAFVDARGMLKRTSYQTGGMDITGKSLIQGLELIKSQSEQLINHK
ncbi:radical SAM protein [Pedobacter polaris]|uniref:Radical SAM protein n=1 Tax=Pedobacter polaris TaxID=2571273 RepID=A0A4V6WN55_9SPHI|nr:radical SAM protein [Pedobacter polaris]TKC08045.1 radical SAM protein [Pedobacter polaris]